ncbi:MAG: hypothetical protein CVU97_03940, partial [Firmicutes bacterium HGW-Firmicutes-21]
MNKKIKAITSLILVFTLTLGMMGNLSYLALAATNTWDGTIADAYDSGNGTADSPYIIATGAQLAYMANQVNTIVNCTSGKYFKLVSDINLTNNIWTPIGINNSDKWFMGNFNGNGHVINFDNVNYTGDLAGVFGFTSGSCRIYDIGVTGSLSSSTATYMGGLGARLKGSIYNCYSTATISSTNTTNSNVYVGGLIGFYEGSSVNEKIRNCYYNGSVSSTSKNAFVGGLAGRLNTGVNSQFLHSYVAGSSTATGTNGAAGRIIGQLDGTISSVYWDGVGNVKGAGSGGGSLQLYSDPIKLADSLNYLSAPTETTGFKQWISNDGSLPIFFVPATDIAGVPTIATAGTDLPLNGTVSPANATNKNIVWSIKDVGTTGATIISDNLVTTATGTVVITATITDGTKIGITVTSTPGTNYTKDFTITVSEPFFAITDIVGVPVSAVAGTD